MIDAQPGAEGLLQARQDLRRRVGALVMDGDDLVEEIDMAEDGAFEEVGAVADAHEGADPRPPCAGLEVGGREDGAGDGFAHASPSAAAPGAVPFSGLAGFQRYSSVSKRGACAS